MLKLVHSSTRLGIRSGVLNAKYNIKPPISITLRLTRNLQTTSPNFRELTEKETKQLQEDLANAEHDHIHLRESETEKNDSFQLGTMLNRASHHHHHATSTSDTFMSLLLDKKQFKKNPGVRITWIGLGVNVGLALGKFFGGIVFHSQALLADAVHAASDLVADFLTLISVNLSKKPPTKEYPYGFGKVETIGGLAVSSILAFAGFSIGYSSLISIVGPIIPHTLLEILHIHAHSHAVDIATNVNAAWIAAGSIAVKEWLFQCTKKIALEQNSSVLLANAWHHRVDSLTSLVALVTISSGYLFGITSLDAVGGLLVSGLVLKAGISGMASSCKELLDKALSETDPKYISVENIIRDSLTKMVSNNNSKKPYTLVNLTLLTSGPNLHANLLLEVPLQKWDNVLGIKEFEIVTDHLRNILMANVPHLKQVHVEYIEEKPKLNDEEKKELQSQREMDTAPIPEAAIKCDHDHGHNHSHLFGNGGHTHFH
ncbi:Mmt2p SCDLUD_001137 [Saccharomycodes ludwigii]|uniref:Mmt2p n=1 Tax=Saccharomycodes ludwigii TaxID=36035 RepID=UPI001E8247BD|nr:hypothetical protein SCDLUD_001137 [Saccharomycodes ludwigii]KAH3903497.1 hypothetical protein SCDLUD_001137 [Saccharomycodes ludwigii]